MAKNLSKEVLEKKYTLRSIEIDITSRINAATQLTEGNTIQKGHQTVLGNTIQRSFH